MKRYIALLLFVALLSVRPTLSAQFDRYQWDTISTKNLPSGRHENGFVAYKGKFYLIGGRGIHPVNVYDPNTNAWETKKKTPFEMHHFQAVVHDSIIYIVGGMTGRYPKEKPLTHIWCYYPENDLWKKGAEIPKERRRGSAGATVYNDKIFLVGGIKLGHTSGTTNLFDCYDLKTKTWKTLTDAPHIRDHFSAVIAKNKLYCVGGRNTSVHNPTKFSAFFGATVPQVDYYDFEKQTWYTMEHDLAIPSAAGAIVLLHEQLVYFGGESNQKLAHNQTQSLDLLTGRWAVHHNMITGRHGTNAIVHNGAIYTAAGSGTRGGGKLTSLEIFSLR